MKRIRKDIRFVQRGDEYIVEAGNGYFSLNLDTFYLLKTLSLNPQLTCTEIAVSLALELGHEVTRSDVENAVEQLPEIFFSEEVINREMKYSLKLLSGRPLNCISSMFSALFNPYVALLLICASIFAVWNVDFSSGITISNFYILPLVILISIVFHEIGHAAACRFVGGQPSHVGIGFSGLLPTLYTDVSSVWMKSQRSKMIVDIGGVYFQFLFIGIVCLTVPVSNEVLLAVKITFGLIAFTLLPYFKFDGYWLLGDMLGVQSLDEYVNSNIKDAYARIVARELKLINYPKLVFIIFYYSGLGLLYFWMLRSCYNLFRSIGLGVSQFSLQTSITWDTQAIVFSLVFFVFLLITIRTVVMILITLVDSWTFTRELKYLIGLISTIKLLSIFRPLLLKSTKHAEFAEKVSSGLTKSNIAFQDVKVMTSKVIQCKYYGMLWFWVLKKLSARTGLWLLKKTHHVRSARTIEYLTSTNGPMVVAAPHFGAYISSAVLLVSQRQKQVHLFYADPKLDPQNAAFEEFYKKFNPNVSILYNNRRGIANAIKALRNGELIVIMPDVFHGSDLVNVPFLGREIGVMSGIAYFNAKFNAKIVPVVSNFKGGLNVEIYIGPELDTKDEIDSDFYEKKIMAKLFRSLEFWFVQFPQNWNCWDVFASSSKQVDING